MGFAVRGLMSYKGLGFAGGGLGFVVWRGVIVALAILMCVVE